MFYTTISKWLTGVLGRVVFFPSSEFLHGIAIVQVTTQWGAGQEIVSHYSKCLWPNNKTFFKMCAFNFQMHFSENQDFQLQFLKSNWKKYSTIFNRMTLYDTHLCTFLAILLWCFAPGIGLVYLKNHLQPRISRNNQPWHLFTQHQPPEYSTPRILTIICVEK